MVVRTWLTDHRWRSIAAAVSGLTRRGPRTNNRRFIEAVIWVLRTGAPWRDQPRCFGAWSSVYRRYRRWAQAGRWEALRQALNGRSRRDVLFLIDSTIVKAHAHAAGAWAKGGGGQAREALGRSRGGFTTKIHAIVSEEGALVRYLATGGEVNDVTQAEALVEGLEGAGVVGDRAYDADAFIERIASVGMRVVIPSRAHRRSPRRHDEGASRQRHVIERYFGRLKQHRRVATRYDKTALSYLGFVATAAMLIALSGWR